MRKVWDDLVEMLKSPFVGDLDVMHLFLLVGVVLVFAVVWAIILHRFRTLSLEV